MNKHYLLIKAKQYYEKHEYEKCMELFEKLLESKYYNAEVRIEYIRAHNKYNKN